MERLVLELKDIEVSYLDKTILNVDQLRIHQFDRIGIVGTNGSGKSTLLKVIHGQVTPEIGTINRQIDFGYFKQKEAPSLDHQPDYKLLGQLNVPDRSTHEMSGGEQTRLKLAQLLTDYHEGLLIDEPTTHLDATGIDFLVENLTYYYGALVLVSHDRYVLDRLVTKIWEVQNGCVKEYTGNYSDYQMTKKLEQSRQQEQHERYVKEKQRLLAAAEEKMKKASKINQANESMSKRQARATANRMFMTKQKDTSQKSVEKAAKALEKRVEQLERIDAVQEERAVHFPQSEAVQLHNRFPIMADRLTLNAGDKMLLEEASFQFPSGKTIAINGANGSGKSTLLHYILQKGEGLTVSPKASFGVYQQLGYQLDGDKTMLDLIKRNSEYDEGKIRAVLHEMNFTGNDLIKKVCQLSGGEAIRLKLCELFLGSYNILILDEPTNFLDLGSIQALEAFLKHYEGTVLLVSHDREFIKKTADVVYEIKEKKLVHIEG
ncbi:Msr family ABC-F type ribosomal protection protein [Jeotgalibacillus sp. R-1-5s-1]|uniref:Msr family ABC-F type ribosomal protection protein n=1 Tax=Jeotgalibacillus sp. R-1-5s-1 TaxID=2555897 RepID=UPI001069CA4D|nr:ABC-F type ribosomal protection protein [Jeotgalibacillus sp. R-1-5s-1]TFD93623.1 ABC-F type ribosomal protection protein [Jeotgalibacillus sp. R-1-5s-1]